MLSSNRGAHSFSGHWTRTAGQVLGVTEGVQTQSAAAVHEQGLPWATVSKMYCSREDCLRRLEEIT